MDIGSPDKIFLHFCTMPLIKDMLEREVRVPDNPQRIISLCPSQTMTLADLGCSERLAGITRFCIHPEEVYRSVKRIGGTKRVNYEAIAELQPDLIIGEKEENTQEMIQQLEKEYPVYMTDVTDIPSCYEMVRNLGMITQTEIIAEKLVQDMKDALGRIRPLEVVEIAYLIWREPWMVAGRNNFIDAILEVCGFRNVFTGLPGRYPKITAEWLQDAAPVVLLLSDEPYPFGEKHKSEFLQVLPQAKIFLVNGEYFSWYGSRIKTIDEYINPLLAQIREELT